MNEVNFYQGADRFRRIEGVYHKCLMKVVQRSSLTFRHFLTLLTFKSISLNGIAYQFKSTRLSLWLVSKSLYTSLCAHNTTWTTSKFLTPSLLARLSLAYKSLSCLMKSSLCMLAKEKYTPTISTFCKTSMANTSSGSLSLVSVAQLISSLPKRRSCHFVFCDIFLAIPA